MMRNDPRSHGLWEASAPQAPKTRCLDERVRADVVIVGAGFTGLSAALHLAEAGANVRVLEAADVGFGGSGRNVGLVNAGMWVVPDALIAELGELYGRRLLDLLGSGPQLVFDLVRRYGIECEETHTGTLHCAVGPSGYRDISERYRQWKSLGAPVELLDAESAARVVGTNAYSGALLDRRAGTIQPLAYVRGLAKAAINVGAHVHSSSAVVRVEDAGEFWRLHTAAGGIVEAEWVVVATNAYPAVEGLWPKIRTELVHLPYFNMATAPLSVDLQDSILPDRQGAWDTKQVLSSFRFDRSGRLVFGSVGALKGAGVDIHRRWAHRALVKLFPQLRDVRFEHEWFGSIGMTSNSLPRFHRPARNTVSFSGYNGRGIAPGTTFGRELARLIGGTVSEADMALPVSQFDTVRIREARELYYEVGAKVAHVFGARL